MKDETDIIVDNQEHIITDEPEQRSDPYFGSTYEIVSKVAYLIGVPKNKFEEENTTLKLHVFEKINIDKNARIIRDLCMLRTAVERNFKNIADAMKFDYKTIMSLSDFVPVDAFKRLHDEGIFFSLHKLSGDALYQLIIEINKFINNRINNCKNLFPIWLSWEYIKDLFIMPNGTNEAGTKQAAEKYYTNRSLYPYGVYINWRPKDYGNILFNDKKFVTLLYKWNGDEFNDMSKVTDVSGYIKGTVYEYIQSSRKVVIVVDCENSDPYKLCATLRGLDYSITQKISSVILFDDVNAASTWRILEQFTSIPVEHVMTKRVKEDKSLVDIMLTARACQEHYQNNVDAFIIVSSDSDYWGLISSLPMAKFFVMIERDNCGPDLKNALVSRGINYCYIDDFYSGNIDDIKQSALFGTMRKYIDDNVHLNIREMFAEAIRSTRIEMSEDEEYRFFNKYVRTINMRIDQDGNVIIEFRNK